MTRRTFLGLGGMGSPMAGHHLAKRRAATVYDRTVIGPAIKAMACVGTDDDLRAVFPGAKAGL